jgi:hypothetical protein
VTPVTKKPVLSTPVSATNNKNQSQVAAIAVKSNLTTSKGTKVSSSSSSDSEEEAPVTKKSPIKSN